MVVLEMIRSALTRAVLFALRGYQRVISPCLPSACRFAPSCSQYMMEAIRKKGLLVGVLKGTLRVLRCNPLFPGGHDPVR